ncbi:MAG: hypothetical protein JST67_05540 [Bacteroidetes bacterium]|nr:hypothetical protein [Bacteroidota bacterium]
MKKLVLAILFGSPFLLPAQDTLLPKKTKVTWYGVWGYNRDWFTNSTIHFVNHGNGGPNDPVHGTYDFTIHDVTAHDKPQFDHIAGSWSDLVNVTIPQFNFRIGCYFNDKQDFGIELSYDHAKYVVTDGQNMHFTGTVEGHPLKYDSIPSPHDFHFEHTDGANFWMLNFIKRWALWTSKNQKNSVGFIVKPGIGTVMPRTDVTIFSHRLNNDWHFAGIIGGVETGMRAYFLKHLVIEFTVKASYADYMKCLVQGYGNGTASHTFGTLSAILNVGYQFYANKPTFNWLKRKSKRT